ncbi:MAG TPA: ATP-binding protein [Candidatus Tectomicrobia bacterium]|nr:ATP-binding protein [Candidatus Tectomicrobia bacterium]
MIIVLRVRSLQTKLLLGTTLVICLLMTGVLVVVEQRQRVAVVEEVERRGQVLARDLAALSQTPLLLYNFTALEQHVTRLALEHDVPYAIVLDADGRVAAHSGHPERVGLPLPGPVAERAVAATALLTQEVIDEDGHAVYDFAVPITVDGQKWGTVRVGLSKRRMEAQIRQTRRELGALTAITLLLGGVGAALVARQISRPVRALAAGAAAISRGDLDQRIEPATHDEVGALATAFNDMAGELRRQRAALEDAHAELRRRFDELADLKTYTDDVLASLTTGIVTVDLNGRVVTLNQAAELLTGFFAGEAVGRFCTEVFAPTPELGELLMETLATRAPIAGATLTLRRRNGRAVPVEVATAPLRGREGKEQGAIATIRDLTPVRELEQRLRRSDRLAAVGTLAAGLAHEIRNPVVTLLTFTRRLARRPDDEALRQKVAAILPPELQRINGIVGRLLELARPPRQQFLPTRLPALVEGVLDAYAGDVEARGITVRREVGRDLPAIVADDDALHRALANLVQNAIEAMPSGGVLSVRLGWTGAAALPRASRRGAGPTVSIEIEDTGPGIAPHDVERIFNPFFTRKAGGTGLGLAITHKIVEDHGGTIDVRSVPGSGTVFRIVLPLVAEPPVEASERDGPLA